MASPQPLEDHAGGQADQDYRRIDGDPGRCGTSSVGLRSGRDPDRIASRGQVTPAVAHVTRTALGYLSSLFRDADQPAGLDWGFMMTPDRPFMRVDLRWSQMLPRPPYRRFPRVARLRR